MNSDRLTTLIGVLIAFTTLLISQHLLSSDWGGFIISLLMALQGYFTNKRSVSSDPEDTLRSSQYKDFL